METFMKKPMQVYSVLVLAAAVGFALAYVERVAWIGEIGWWGFNLALLALVLFSVALVVRRMTKKARN